jgi:hypothetical protein
VPDATSPQPLYLLGFIVTAAACYALLPRLLDWMRIKWEIIEHNATPAEQLRDVRHKLALSARQVATLHGSPPLVLIAMVVGALWPALPVLLAASLVITTAKRRSARNRATGLLAELGQPSPDDDIAAGRIVTHSSAENFLNSLDGADATTPPDAAVITPPPPADVAKGDHANADSPTPQTPNGSRDHDMTVAPRRPQHDDQLRGDI